MSRKRIIFLGSAILVFIFFTKLIPEYVIYDHEFLWGIIAAAGVAVLLYQALKADKEKLYNPETHQAQKPRMVVATMASVFSAVATIFAVYFMSIPRTDAYIKKNSVIAKGTVVDGKSTTTKRRGSSSTTYELDVAFTANGRSVRETVDVNSSNWNQAGKGMPVLVAYAKEHPGMCKILFNAEDVKKYTSSSSVKSLTLNDVTALFAKRKGYLMNELEKISLGWSKDETEKGNTYYYNSVFKSTVVNTDDYMYLLETDNAENYNKLLAEARKNMKVVYDSIPSNNKKGALLKSDSLQIRFQQYAEYASETTGGEFSIPVMRKEIHYVVGIAGKNLPILLPGDVKNDDAKSERDMLREKLMESLQNRNN